MCWSSPCTHTNTHYRADNRRPSVYVRRTGLLMQRSRALVAEIEGSGITGRILVSCPPVHLQPRTRAALRVGRNQKARVLAIIPQASPCVNCLSILQEDQPKMLPTQPTRYHESSCTLTWLTNLVGNPPTRPITLWWTNHGVRESW